MTERGRKEGRVSAKSTEKVRNQILLKKSEKAKKGKGKRNGNGNCENSEGFEERRKRT